MMLILAACSAHAANKTAHAPYITMKLLQIRFELQVLQCIDLVTLQQHYRIVLFVLKASGS